MDANAKKPVAEETEGKRAGGWAAVKHAPSEPGNGTLPPAAMEAGRGSMGPAGWRATLQSLTSQNAAGMAFATAAGGGTWKGALKSTAELEANDTSPGRPSLTGKATTWRAAVSGQGAGNDGLASPMILSRPTSESGPKPAAAFKTAPSKLGSGDAGQPPAPAAAPQPPAPDPKAVAAAAGGSWRSWKNVVKCKWPGCSVSLRVLGGTACVGCEQMC